MTLKDYLSDHGYNMNSFAAEKGLSQATLWRIVHEKRRVRPDVAQRISKATGGAVSEMELLYPDHDHEN